MSWLLVACLLTPFVTAVMCFLSPSARGVQSTFSVLGALVLVVLGAVLLSSVWRLGPVATQLGGWPAPYGITFVADALSAVLVLVAGIVVLGVALFAIVDIDTGRMSGGFHGFLHVLMMGVVGAFLTGDLFNLYVWFEVMLIASFALMTLGGDRVQLDGAVKYVAINLVSTVLLLAAIGLIHGLTGTLNMADLHGRLASLESQSLANVVAVLFLIAFGIKAAVFPLFFWLPASYHTPPISIATVFAALMTKVGVYAILRTFTLIYADTPTVLQTMILLVALATMIVGVLGALAFSEIRRILAFHIISSIGFMLFGLGIGTPLAIAASVFYMIHGILVKATLFMLAGIIGRLGGSFRLADLGGLYRARPGFSVLYLLAAFSLMGLPPMSGFWAKLMIVEAGLDAGAGFVLFVVLTTSLLTFIPLIRIWNGAFWQPASPHARLKAPIPTMLLLPVLILSGVSVGIGLAPAALVDVAYRSANELTDSSAYVRAVLGEKAATANSIPEESSQ